MLVGRRPIDGDMSVSGVSGSGAGGSAGANEAERVALVLKKVADVRKTEAQALVQLISQASNAVTNGSSGVGSIISYYA